MAAQLQSLAEDSTDWLIVPEGQFTFDVEGDDNPDSGYFSRVAHAPPGASGITLGRGFDLYQQRHKAKKILQKVGVDSGLIEFLLPAIGLQGDTARIYHENNKGELNNFVITRRQQYDLYLETYPFYRIDTARLYDKHVLSEPSVEVPMFESLDYRIRDILIDMRYRGDFRQLGWDRASWWDRELAIDFRMAIRSNNAIVLAMHFERYKYEEGSYRASWNDRNKYWKIPQDRYQRRIGYLRIN